MAVTLLRLVHDQARSHDLEGEAKGGPRRRSGWISVTKESDADRIYLGLDEWTI